MRKTFTLLAGIDGVGKSSFAGSLLAQPNNELGSFIDTDRLTAAYGGDRLAGGKAALEQIRNCLKNGISFTQETTLSGRQPLETVQEALACGFQIRMHYIGLGSLEESLCRIANRVRRGGHDIPEADVRRRFQKRMADLRRILPFCGEAKFYDNENGFMLAAVWQNGLLIPVGTRVLPWVRELAEVCRCF